MGGETEGGVGGCVNGGKEGGKGGREGNEWLGEGERERSEGKEGRLNVIHARSQGRML